MLGIYIAVPLTICVIALILAVLLCYVCCKRRFRLNWYERTLLEGLESRNSSKNRDGDSEKDFLHRHTPERGGEQHSRSISSLDRSSGCDPRSTLTESLKQGLPNITIGHGSANVVTRKVKQQQQWEEDEEDSSCSMGSHNSSPHSPAHHLDGHISDGGGGGYGHNKSPSRRSGVGQTLINIQHDKRSGGGGVTFNTGSIGGGGIYPLAANMSRRSSMTAPVILPATSGRKNSSSGSTGSNDGRRDSAEFWVPPTVLKKKRAQSLVPSLGLFQESQDKEGECSFFVIIQFYKLYLTVQFYYIILNVQM